MLTIESVSILSLFRRSTLKKIGLILGLLITFMC